MIGLLSVLAAAPALAATEPIVRTLPPSMPALEIDNPRGVIEVDYDPSAPRTTLTASPMFWSEGCEVVFTGDAALARVEIHKNGELAASGCRTRFQVVLAGETALHLQGQRGKVLIAETRGPVDIDLHRGHVDLQKVFGPTDVTVVSGRVTGSPVSDELHLAVDRGRVELTELRVPVFAEVGVGRIALDYDLALEGTATASVGVGRVKVRFPYGTWLDRQAVAKVGSVRTEIPHRVSSHTRLEAAVKLGRVEVDTIIVDEETEAVASN